MMPLMPWHPDYGKCICGARTSKGEPHLSHDDISGWSWIETADGEITDLKYLPSANERRAASDSP